MACQFGIRKLFNIIEDKHIQHTATYYNKKNPLPIQKSQHEYPSPNYNLIALWFVIV
jgi:hypothetical protein